MNFFIKNPTLVNEGNSFRASVFVSDGKIAKITTDDSFDYGNATVINAEGCFLIPGVIDEHVHFREPGLTHKADIFSESRAAVAGGVTSFMEMPNTVPQTLTQELLQQKFDIAAEKSLANYSFYLGATNDNIEEILKSDPKKVCGIKVFMGSSTGNMLIDNDEALERIFSESPCLVAVHCEDEAIVRQNTLHYKLLAEKGEITPNAALHPLIRTAEACFRSSAKAVETASKYGTRLHVTHVSTADELGLFRNDIPLVDKKITAETCVGYLWFSDEDYKDKGFKIKCNPSIKTKKDRAALRNAVNENVIDTIATDHAPHAANEKFVDDYFKCPSGFPSVQHSLAMMLKMYEEGIFTIERIVQMMCHNPAILFRINKRGFIKEGYYADLAIVGRKPLTIGKDNILYKCGWTPYEGIGLNYGVTHTFVNGELVYDNGSFNDEARGKRLEFNV